MIFNFYIGIDQTGACLPGGRARPLPFAFVDARDVLDARDARSEPMRLRAVGIDGKPLTLETFSQAAMQAVLERNGVNGAQEVLRSPRTALLVDSVFGLPHELGFLAGDAITRDLFVRAASHEGGYGLKTAAAFFDSLKGARTDFPVRECEGLAGANSVFRTQPYQKNIQCGTYRIWRDLGIHGSDWLHFRYFERTRATKPILFESYPSLFWREFLGLRTRDRTQLARALRGLPVAVPRRDLDLLTRDADHADAAVLAIGGFLFDQRGGFDLRPSRDAKLSREGWITGLARP